MIEPFLFGVMFILTSVGLATGPFGREEYWGTKNTEKYDEFEQTTILQATRLSYKIIILCPASLALFSILNGAPLTLSRNLPMLVLGWHYIAILLPSLIAEIKIPIVKGDDT